MSRNYSHNAISILVQRIRDNDPSLTELDLRSHVNDPFFQLKSGGDDFHGLIEALRLNHTITNVRLFYSVLMMLKEEERLDFLEAVGALPRLEHMTFVTVGLSDPYLRMLNAGLSKTQGRLKSLSLESVLFRGNHGYQTERTTNTNDTEFVKFLTLLGNDLMESMESFTLRNVEDTFDLDASVNVLVALPNLRELVIDAYDPWRRQRLTKQTVTRLFESPTMRSLSLRGLGLGFILAEPLMMIGSNHTLESLSLEQNGLEFSAGMAIAYLLSVNRTLKELNLSSNTIPDDCGSAIAAAMADNDTLISLDLSANILELNTSRRVAHLLARSDSALQILALNQNPLRDEGVTMIAAGLECNTVLKELSLAETKISCASCSVIVASLQTNTTLERLNLANNKLRDTACIALSVALENNSTLTSLNLQGNELRDNGVLRLTEMLKINATIERLNLGNNPMLTTKSYEALQSVLIDHNYSVQHLWLPTTVEMVMPNCKIPSFTLLNRLGRKRLLEELDNAELWMEVMEKALQSDLDVLYFLTRANPAVLSWMFA